MSDTHEEVSEFSINEVLYMGSASLTYIVEIRLDDSARDPFDIVAEREEFMGRPLVAENEEAVGQPLALLAALIKHRRTPM